MLDKTDIHNRGLAADRIITILRKLKQSDPEIFNLLGRYISGLLNYKGVEINKINEYFSLSKLIIPLKQALRIHSFLLRLY
jgi:hypothetical protein